MRRRRAFIWRSWLRRSTEPLPEPLIVLPRFPALFRPRFLALFICLVPFATNCIPRTKLKVIEAPITAGVTQKNVLHVDARGALSPTTELRLWEAAGQVDVVYVGEEHDSAKMHRFELLVLQRLVEMDPSTGLGIEMLPTTMQAPLDDFVAGRTDEKAFLAAVDWNHTWGYPWADYRPLLMLCRDQHLRAYALNASSSLAKAVAHTGVAGLSNEQRKNLPEMVAGPAAHRAQFDEAFSSSSSANVSSGASSGIGADGGVGHPPLTPAQLEHFYEAQLLWDETMAESVAHALSGKDAPRRLLIVTGLAHARRFAVPERARRRGIKHDLVVLPVEPNNANEAAAMGADFLWPLDP